MTNLKKAAAEIVQDLNRLTCPSPNAGAVFFAMMASLAGASLNPAALRAVAATALGVANGCTHCVRRNARDAAHAGVPREQFKLALLRGVLMGRNGASICAAEALVDFDAARPQQKQNMERSKHRARTKRSDKTAADRPGAAPAAFLKTPSTEHADPRERMLS